jgi:hypothetical protein
MLAAEAADPPEPLTPEREAEIRQMLAEEDKAEAARSWARRAMSEDEVCVEEVEDE